MNKQIIIISMFLLLGIQACKKPEQKPTPEDLSKLTPEQIIERVDALMYYPQNQGLTSMKADVYTPYITNKIEEFKRNDPESAEFWDSLNIKVSFEWNSQHGAHYTVQGIPDNMKKTQESLMSVFKKTEIMMIPKTQAQMFQHFKLESDVGQDSISITGTNPQQALFKYILTVDKNYRILKYDFMSAGSISTTHVTLKQAGDLYLVEKLTTLNNMAAPDQTGMMSVPEEEPISEILVMVGYNQVQGYYLTSWFEYSAMSLDTRQPLVDPLRVEFSNLRINED